MLVEIDSEEMFCSRYENVSDDWEPPQAKPYKDLVSVDVPATQDFPQDFKAKGLRTISTNIWGSLHSKDIQVPECNKYHSSNALPVLSV